jgi:plasmid replication initiation protein
MPYLAQVRQKFVLYNLREIGNFASLYTTRLYELLQEFKETGWMLKSVEQLREAFAIGNKLKLYSNFKRRTFEPACKEINDIYDIDLNFEEIKEDKKVTAIRFSFKYAKIVKSLDNKRVAHNIYKKPAVKKQAAKSFKERTAAVLKDQLNFESLENQNKFETSNEESTTGLKSISSIFNNFFQKVSVNKDKTLEEKRESGSSIVKAKQHITNTLKEFGLNTKTINKIIKENPEQIIQDAIKAVDLQISKGSVRNPAGMLVKAITEKWNS